MSLNVVYVEDDRDEREGMEKTIAASNKGKPLWRHVNLDTCRKPEELKKHLNDDVDLVLSDVHFPASEPASMGEGEYEPRRLEQIINIVRKFDKESSRGFPLPIIAYTSKGPNTLQYCQRFRNDLYDIWHKMSADAHYVAWRFQRLEADLRRQRPDASIQKMIASLSREGKPEAYSHVKAMVRNYGEGRTEYDQILKCRGSIQAIIDDLAPKHVKPLMGVWDAMVEYEPLLRAASSSLRGIARHSINVFWLGYWILNDPWLRSSMLALWKGMISKRRHNEKVVSESPERTLVTTWVLASLFHDVGKFAEDGLAIIDGFNKAGTVFDGCGIGSCPKTKGSTKKLDVAVEEIMFDLSEGPSDALTERLLSHIRDGITRKEPDHGAVAAAKIVDLLVPHRLVPNRDVEQDKGKDQDPLSFCAMEAARSILLHSCLPPLSEGGQVTRTLHWNRDPVACLLLFCDQIQTWDRHRIDDNYRRDYPDRAELSHLDLAANPESASKPILTGCIDYIAPGHVDVYPEIRRRIAEDLHTVLLEKPKHTLIHLIEAGSWPFCVDLECALSGEPLLSKEQEPMHMNFK